MFILRAHILHLLYYFFKASKKYLEYANELATIDKIDFWDGSGLENAGEEANCHIIVAHFVEFLSRDYFFLEKNEQMHDDSAVEIW